MSVANFRKFLATINSNISSTLISKIAIMHFMTWNSSQKSSWLNSKELLDVLLFFKFLIFAVQFGKFLLKFLQLFMLIWPRLGSYSSLLEAWASDATKSSNVWDFCLPF